MVNFRRELAGIWEGIWGHLNFCHMNAYVAFPAEGKGEKTRDQNSPPCSCPTAPRPPGNGGSASGRCLPLHQVIHSGLGPTAGCWWDPGESALTALLPA